MPAASPSLDVAVAAKLEALGERLRERRKALKISAVSAAESAGLSRVTLHRIERGEPSVAMGAYITVANALGIEFELAERVGRTSAKRRSAKERGYPARVRIADFAQLQRLAWQLHGVATLTPEATLGLYERNWKHVDVARLEPGERALIQALVQDLGGGRLLV